MVNAGAAPFAVADNDGNVSVGDTRALVNSVPVMQKRLIVVRGGTHDWDMFGGEVSGTKPAPSADLVACVRSHLA